jgi:branched-chain amino acid transport system substrate-binding protein
VLHSHQKRIRRRCRYCCTSVIVAVVVVVAAIALLVVLPMMTAPRLEVSTIKIGVLGPLTGPFAATGKRHLAGAELAVKEINEKGGVLGAKLELVVYDDKNDVKEAVAAFQKMVEVDKVVAVIGPVSSGIGVALAPEANKAKVPLLLHMAVSDRILTLNNRYVFRTCAPATTMIAAPVAQFIKEQNLKNVAIIIASYEYGFGFRDALVRLLKTMPDINYQVAEAPVGETDFTSYLRKIEPLKPDAIVISGHPPGAPVIVKQALELGLRPKYFIGAYFPTEYMLAALGEDGLIEANVLLMTCINFDVPEYRQIAEKFYKETGMFLDFSGATGYLNVYHIANAIEKIRSVDPVKIAEYIRTSTFNHPISAWPFRYTEWGELAEARIILHSFERGDPGPINPGAKWVPKIVFKSAPIEPFRPEG